MKRNCPTCDFPMALVLHKNVQLDHCRRCGGTFLDPGEATEIFGVFTDPEQWKSSEITRELGPAHYHCPDHQIPMTTYEVRFGSQCVEIDLCPECGGMWLDAREGVRLRNIVMAAGQARDTDLSENPGIGSYLFQLVSGFPREVWNPVRKTPWLTLTLIAILWLVFGFQLLILFARDTDAYEWLFRTFALMPAEILMGSHLWTLLSNAFLHSGFMHILGNTYFFYIFGDNVEEFLGWRRFLLLFVMAAISGALLQTVCQRDPSIPVIGASGAVAGLMGAYMVLFPKIRMFVVMFFIRFRVNIFIYLGFWVLYNLIMAFTGVGYVAWMDHIGGFVAGAAIAWPFRPRALSECFRQ
ncbi:rhomboid family intramembrane serine protease [Desulfonema ishimotonii]|uniref:Rhomboid family intramembrane serine protease n=1 Tax=Desulfonema ishimotonii TaxID=45657 RepID=A0A401G1W8_9BACT|nr:rhomboid family intramembrane serine protease [Desulfonema ishimotonii]GBC63222.1 rhomboid family intramembrane serine protease [Desulfonema ishimotonii]